MDDRMRVSDADREAVTARLRDHYAEGRLTSAELDERVSAALNAKTFGDLRPLTRDLPGPVPVPPRTAAEPHWTGPHRAGSSWPGPYRMRRRRPPVLLFLLIALFAALAFPGGGWLLFGVFRLFLLVWLVTIVTRISVALMYRRRHHCR